MERSLSSTKRCTADELGAAEDTDTLMLAHDLPPAPSDDDRSSCSPSQPPTTDGTDSTTVGVVGLAGASSRVEEAAANCQPAHSEALKPLEHAALTVPFLTDSVSLTLSRLALLAWLANTSTEDSSSQTQPVSSQPLHCSTSEHLNCCESVSDALFVLESKKAVTVAPSLANTALASFGGEGTLLAASTVSTDPPTNCSCKSPLPGPDTDTLSENLPAEAASPVKPTDMATADPALKVALDPKNEPQSTESPSARHTDTLTSFLTALAEDTDATPATATDAVTDCCSKATDSTLGTNTVGLAVGIAEGAAVEGAAEGAAEGLGVGFGEEGRDVGTDEGSADGLDEG